jgi:hypothetical protein
MCQLLNNKKHYICDIHLSQEYLPIADHEKDHQFKFNEPGDSNQNSHRIPFRTGPTVFFKTSLRVRTRSRKSWFLAKLTNSPLAFLAA